ncbi:ATP-binding cassette, subfamily B, MsbA [Tistlia consotensis]|uniref:ATP-binding cassette, subfamily B, MsbA n=1 Tax=Tistlia consotensis USBA 355 TaxID=560819 RepID=A0A1Y6CG69_9PROT|nr:ABC transporter transmembrane domain-containing protein [Tistlia consotensis]SMF62339.1 ATP-binding cassette, subfamily B, MsbA [Tistlia consotensis USBA 355]SNR94577.1 ATP-binding cassette, subfamily B, MsbA [Tistlia consotensis]
MSEKHKAKVRWDESTRVLVGRLWREHVRRYRGRIAVAIVFMALVAGCTGAMAQLMDPIISYVFSEKNADLLWAIAGAALVVFTVRGFAAYGESVLMSQVGFRVVADLRQRLYERLIRADVAFFNEMPPGQLGARFVNDVQQLQNTVSHVFTGLGRDFLTALALVAVMFYQNWILALIAFVAFPTAILPVLRIGKRMRRVSGNTQHQIGLLSTLLDETFHGARHVKAYGMEGYESERARARIDEVYALQLKGSRVRNVTQPLLEVLGGLAVIGVILYGGNLVIAGDQGPGSFAAFITAVLLAFEPAKRVAKLNNNLQEGLAAAQRVFELIDYQPEIVDRPGARPLALDGGAVRLEGVRFAYDGAPEAALDGLDLEARAGQTVALVGPSGAGKSTVLNLVPRFYDVTAGRVLVDGQDVRDVTLASLRRAVAYVSQEVMLFDDTVRANIAYGRMEASEAELVAAAEAAGADGFIRELPQGYDTPVGPRGSKLSGGQRQRIAIARAMLKNAPILLLDEATSALDSESERHVQQALGKLKEGRTTLVIAHRLSTVVDADLIHVLDRGRVIESGSHAELLARGGAYARLYALQFADEPAPQGEARPVAVAGE